MRLDRTWVADAVDEQALRDAPLCLTTLNENPRSSTQGVDSSSLPNEKGAFQKSILLWQKYYRCGAVRFCQHPNPITGAGGIRGQHAKPLLD